MYRPSVAWQAFLGVMLPLLVHDVYGITSGTALLIALYNFTSTIGA
jgi:hypothetical protein